MIGLVGRSGLDETQSLQGQGCREEVPTGQVREGDVEHAKVRHISGRDCSSSTAMRRRLLVFE